MNILNRFVGYTLIVLFSMMVIPAHSQSYADLWKQVENAEQKDLPQTRLKVLSEIVTKAEKDHAYGQLLKASLMHARVQATVSPDSLLSAVERLQKQAEKAQSYPFQAVCYAVLGKVYQSNPRLSSDWKLLSEDYFHKAVEKPVELAAVKTEDFKPFVVEGKDSQYYGDDLLSLICMETDQYKVLHKYYLTTSNRLAQLFSGLSLLKQENPYKSEKLSASNYIPRLDSLADAYANLAECGEIAIARYEYMDAQTDATAEQKVAYIDNALSRWGTWKRMDVLRNARNLLTAYEFHVSMERVSVPNREQTLRLKNLRGVNELALRVYKVKVDGDTKLNPDNKQDYQTMKPLLTLLKSHTITRKYTARKEYEVFDDSLQLSGLPVGVYMIEVESKPKTEVARQLYFVSNIRVLTQSLPNNQVRFVVVNAATGQPVKGAQLRLEPYARRNANSSVITVTCNNEGECVYTFEDPISYKLFATAKDDRYCPTRNVYTNNMTYRYEVARIQEHGHVFTDRVLYRPGQTVHVAAIVYEVMNGIEHVAKAGKELKAVLRDANYKVVAEQSVKTDDFGTAACDFALPTTGLTGGYSISVGNYRQYFRVEEYKRPTFQVEIPQPALDYKAGDTITVKGMAKSYAGVPVQGARVSYRVERRLAFWWVSYSRYWQSGFMGESASDTELYVGETTTDDDGSFQVQMPMVLPESLNQTMFYNFVVTADVTDTAGETHHGELSLPLGNKKSALSLELPEKVIGEELPMITFSLRNAAGTALDGEVNYQLDNGKWLQAKANTPSNILTNELKGGKHELIAVCGEDTLKRSFIVFSLDDKRPAVEIDDWFYCSTSQFPNDGKPVTLQVGSSAKDVYMVYTILADGKVIEQGAVKRSNELLNRKFTYKEEYGNGLSLCFAWYKNDIGYLHSITIQRPMPDKQLQLKWETFRDRLTPGQQEEWKLKIESPTGEKVTDASLLATLYDKSLDQIQSHNWLFTPYTNVGVPSLYWTCGIGGTNEFNGYLHKAMLEVKNLTFNQFDQDCFPYPWMRLRGIQPRYSRAKAANATPMMETELASTQTAIGAFDVAGDDEVVDLALNGKIAGLNIQKETKENLDVQVRENLQETAFFYPQLMADSTGIVAIKFTLPESLTTWRFMGLAHTKDMMYGLLTDEAVAQKNLMIQPNVPRFLRMGDQAIISARVFNTTDRKMEATAQLLLLDAESNTTVLSKQMGCLLEANGTVSAMFEVEDSCLANHSLLICKMMVSGDGFSDGEQHYMPILSNRERVTVTIPFTQTQPGTKTINLSGLTPNSSNSQLTIEYTNNPAWLMIQALPTIGHPYDHCVICQASAYYANSIGMHILKQNPQAKHVFEMWKHEKPQSPSLSSQLEQNEELKDLLLNETPWMMDAEREAEQKQRLADFFDENLMNNRLSSAIEKVQKLQHADGSWSWWEGMEGSFYMTVEVSEMLVRLQQMTGAKEECRQMLQQSFNYMDKEIVEMVAKMKQEERKGHRQSFPTHKALQYLYISTIDGRSLTAKVSEAQNYLKKLLQRDVKNQSLYEKALSAIILRSHLYVKSLKEYTVYKEDMGRYFDSPRAGYSWRDYRIPTQVAVIEALQRLTPKDTKTIDEMRRWLLQEKRAQAWDTPINSVNAVYAFLNGNQESLRSQTKTVLKIDGEPLSTSEATAGVGYVKTTMPAENKTTFTAEKKSAGTSWGAVYMQFIQETKDIADQGSDISVKREILSEKQQFRLKVGDRVKVRITIEAKRDLDFVEVIDRRAACMEPISQLSGYRYGYYCTPKDNATHYFFNMLRKGKHVIETEYYIDREGIYETGTCIVQCAYAPAFRATTHSETLKVSARD